MSTRSPYSIYLEHLAAGRLAYQFSPSVNQAVFHPRAVSPFDVDETLEWRVSQGLGTVYSTTVVHKRGVAPYNVALVDCDEGFRLMTRIEDCTPDQVEIGMRVRFKTHVPEDAEDDPYPVFVPEGVA